MVRAKFLLREIHNFSWSETSKKFVFAPQYDQSIPEDQRFAKASPDGRFEIQVDNPAAIAAFKIGKQYYFDIHEVEPSQV